MAFDPNEIARSFDFSRLIGAKRSPFHEMEERADAMVARLRPMTVEERMVSFRDIGFRPHGIYLPNDVSAFARLSEAMKRVSAIGAYEDRLRAYYQLQDATERWAQRGIPGHWTGQQAVARSRARFRLVAWGRRGGKTFYASREAVGMAKSRPRSWVWVAAPTMLLVGRCFDMINTLLTDLGVPILTRRNTHQEKLTILGNGSRIEGVSLDDPKSAAGAAVDLAIVDEAAQVGETSWTRSILPVLTDREGYAILISSWEGEEGFFFTKAEEARKDRSGQWEVFQAPSWDNFFEFPQGRRSAKVQAMEGEMDPIDFLEQYGAIPARNRDRVYPEFKEKVHVGRFPFDSSHPVRIVVDPSSGADPYAVRIYQDYGEWYKTIDEYYEMGVTVEDIIPVLKRRPWWVNVEEGVIDSNWPVEADRWNALVQFPVIPVFNKPEVRERVPIHRNFLRDPLRFHKFYRERVNEVLAGMGLPADADLDMDPAKQKAIAIQVEESLGDNNLSPQDIEVLRNCARSFVDQSCVHTISEYNAYAYKRNSTEKFARGKDHLMDCGGYYDWMYHRDDAAPERELPRNYVAPKEAEERPEELLTGRSLSQDSRMGAHLASLRKHYTGRHDDASYLRSW